jgi:hypothetical protein
MSLDTRHKILTLDEASALAEELHRNGSPPTAFVTHLEVLRADHIRQLEEFAAATPGKLFVILTDPDSPLIPLAARAELCAALRVVDYVIPSPAGAAPALAAIQAAATVHDEEEDRGRTRQLIEHVRSRARI